MNNSLSVSSGTRRGFVSTPPSDTIPVSPKVRRVVLLVLHYLVLVLSVALIAMISYTTFRSVPFMQDRTYMTFQLLVCLVFIADFFIELWLTPRGEKRYYLRARWLFLLLSVPYLNIIDGFSLHLSADALYFLRFVPLCRGGLALAIVLDYIASNRATGMFLSYMAIMVLVVYFAGLIFYEREQPVNPGVASYWDSFWWCCMQTTTLGCSVEPVTPAGRILSVVLSLMGCTMYPLFTVYVTSLIIKNRDMLNKIKNKFGSVKSPSGDTTLPSDGAQRVAQHDKNA